MARRRLISRSEPVGVEGSLCRSQSMSGVILIIALIAACQLGLADCEQQGSSRQEPAGSNQERFRLQQQQHSSHQLSQKQNEIFPIKFAPNQQKQQQQQQQHKNNASAHLHELIVDDESQLQLVSSSPAPAAKFNQQQQTFSTASPSAGSSTEAMQNFSSLSAAPERFEASTKPDNLGPSSSPAPSEPASGSSAAQATSGEPEARHKQLQQARATAKAGGARLGQAGGDVIDPMATSQSVSFAEPLMASSNRQEQQQHQQAASTQQFQSQPQQLKSAAIMSGASNRWTHFGARLKPLTTSGADHHSADSRSLAAFAHNNNNKNGQQTQRAGQTSGAGQALSGNQIGDVSANDDADDADDDQDSEALLYKMMQQQGFLTGSIWQQEQPTSAAAAAARNAVGQAAELSQPLANEQEGDAASRAANNAAGNSKRVIKLLKSYSHIHQVDDSDDQIRGSYTRVQPNRNNDNNNSWQRASQQHNRNRPTNGGQQQSANRHSPQHIFVSSQPMARAYSNPNARRQQPAQGEGADMYNSQEGAPYSNYPAQPGEGGQAGSPESGEDANQQGPPEEDDFECPNNGIFADEASGCQSYHVCQSGAQVQQKFQCPMGTLFNNIILTCDFAHNVKCKGAANADAPKVASSADEINNEPIHRNPQQQPQPQQIPRASNQMSEQSFVRPQQQQARWQQQASSGPRSLKIGQSQYNQHQAAAQQVNPQAQAVSAYPHPQPAAVAPSGDDSSDDSDDEPLEPLKPATLPPPRQQLPYSAPPAPQQPSNGAQFGHQSAHRSQYGGSTQYQQQQPSGSMNNYLPMANRGYDGDSAASPVFASRDEPRTTEATTNLITNQVHQSQRQKPAQAQTPAHSSDAQSFNLVINHVTPTRSHQMPAKMSSNPAVGDAYNVNGNKKLQPAQIGKQQYQMQPANQALLNEAYNKKLLQERNKQQFVVNSKQYAGANPQMFVKQHQQRINQAYDNQRQQQATQLKSVHVDASAPMVQQPQQQQQQQQQQQPQQQAALRAARVVDLTNDKRAAVSSEALNDGLLLIVRHSQQGSQAAANSNLDNQQQQYYRQSAAASRSSGVQQNAQGQAYAIDPAVVRPDSPIDAQLFPNVQRVLAASQPSVSHQAPPQAAGQHQHAASATTQYIQHVQPQAQQQQQISPPLNRISLPLQPMEPPKANVQYANKNAHQSSNNSPAPDSLQVVASSSAISSSHVAVSPSPANQAQTQAAQVKPLAENKDRANVQHGKQQRHTTANNGKKIKKVKANQSSAAKKHSQRNAPTAKSTTTTAASASQTEPIKTMTQQKQQAELKSTSSTVSPSAASLADQPVALIEEQQFLRTNSRLATPK